MQWLPLSSLFHIIQSLDWSQIVRYLCYIPRTPSTVLTQRIFGFLISQHISSTKTMMSQYPVSDFCPSVPYCFVPKSTSGIRKRICTGGNLNNICYYSGGRVLWSHLKIRKEIALVECLFKLLFIWNFFREIY